ncbi:hypothetical protein [Bradyrhizobium sp. CCBAU 11361]|uniref:hypothetical protein n=1 Tax=Bradyrhizobium sp. CCBAU 11361 TaxID=1630812 RepID=UPI00230636B8|nr:hypothetical protein [Bradyrhizobium sp. CCBAU 11361]MDA9494966.1 hypothetical protein [Bradyrhizobium sp. CCBAU 11361]
MSMLTHCFDRPFDGTERLRIAKERKAQLKRFALRALTVLSMGSVLTALIALRTAIYVWHLHA